jgi:hypothetical protein
MRSSKNLLGAATTSSAASLTLAVVCGRSKGIVSYVWEAEFGGFAGRPNWLCVRKGLVNVEAGLGEHDVVTAFFPERGSEANIEFVGLAFGGGGMRVVAQGVAGFDALNQGAEGVVEMSDVPDVEDFSAGLVDDFANVDEARN